MCECGCVEARCQCCTLGVSLNLFSTLLFETRSLTKPEACQLARLADQQALRILLSWHPHLELGLLHPAF